MVGLSPEDEPEERGVWVWSGTGVTQKARAKVTCRESSGGLVSPGSVDAQAGAPMCESDTPTCDSDSPRVSLTPHTPNGREPGARKGSGRGIHTVPRLLRRALWAGVWGCHGCWFCGGRLSRRVAWGSL